VRTVNDGRAVDQGCYFEPESGLFVIDFLAEFCRQSKAPFGGQPLEVTDWQFDLLMRLYGWKMPDGRRRFRDCYVEIPKKNGKSTLISGIGLYHLMGDGEEGAECYINAYTRGQAGIIYDEAEKMVRSSPELKSRLYLKPSGKIITHPASNSKLEALSADVPSKDGFNSSLTIFDELHRQRTADMWRIFEYAGASRRQPLRISITTAGEDRESICYEQHEYAELVASGKATDIHHLGVIYAADPKKDKLDSPDTWAKANPSLGVTIRLESFRDDFNKARANPKEWPNFQRLRFNIWRKDSSAYLDQDAWDRCGKIPLPPIEEFAGESAWGAFDLSQTEDLTALAAVFKRDQLFYLYAWFWIPEENLEVRARKHRVNYEAWHEEGWIETTAGAVVDYDGIEERVKALATDHELRRFYGDKYNATQLGNNLIKAGLPFEFMQQGFLSMNAPCKEFDRLLKSGRIVHGNNPVLAWHFANAELVHDAAGNWKLDKGKSRSKIDGAVASIMALAAATDEDGESTYEEEDLLILGTKN
jgi:phage terminase large subunit-like protein